MRAVAYLSHALALRQAPSPAPSPATPALPGNVPDNATCIATIGTPGSVYICGAPGDCSWWEYKNMTQECRQLGGALVNPSLVGPDFGGHCHLYKNPGCKDGDEVVLVEAVGAPLPVPAKPTKIVCPGIKRENIPPNVVKAIKCFDKLDHPMATPGPSPTSTPPAPGAALQIPPPAPPADTPPGCSTSPAVAVAARQNAVPTPDPCKCIPTVGHPGAVYLCAHPAHAVGPPRCEWHDYDASQTCQSLATIGFPGADMLFVGPDFGGRCSFYTTVGCDAGSEVVVGGEKDMVCPGKAVAAGGELASAVAMRCFPSLDRNVLAPAPVGGAAQATPTVTVGVSPSPV